MITYYFFRRVLVGKDSELSGPEPAGSQFNPSMFALASVGQPRGIIGGIVRFWKVCQFLRLSFYPFLIAFRDRTLMVGPLTYPNGAGPGMEESSHMRQVHASADRNR